VANVHSASDLVHKVKIKKCKSGITFKHNFLHGRRNICNTNEQVNKYTTPQYALQEHLMLNGLICKSVVGSTQNIHSQSKSLLATLFGTKANMNQIFDPALVIINRLTYAMKSLNTANTLT